jgi:acetyl esterase/lipase
MADSLSDLEGAPEQPWPLATGALPEVQLRDHGVRVREGAVYAVLTGFRPLRLDLHLPPVDRGPVPVVVWIHGGAFMHGDRTALPPLLEQERLFTRLPLAGLAVASVEYRLSGEARFPAQLEDVQAAIRWLRARHRELGIDPSRVAVWGESAGGYLAAFAGVAGAAGTTVGRDAVPFAEQPTTVAAVVDWYGPTDFAAMDRQAPPDSKMRHDDADSPESRLIGAAVQERPDLVARADPCRWATSSAPPFLIMHGTHDRLVPFGQSELLAARLRELGVPVELRAIDGADHVFEGYAGGAGLVDEVVAFLVRVLAASAAAGDPPRP